MSTKTLHAGLTGLISLVALGTVGTACAGATFLPGLYETKVSYPDEGPDVETTRECLTPAEAQEESLEQRLAEAVQDASCKFTQRSIGGGRFAIAGTCSNDGMRSTLKQTGTYAPTAMTMNMSMTVAGMPGAPVGVNMVMSSRRIAANCPAGSDND